MFVAYDAKESPEYLAMIALMESGIIEDKDRVRHWNNLQDPCHKFWSKFKDYLDLKGYEIVDKNKTEK